jgi:hypothetical protein
MNVGDLIEKLTEFPADMEVTITDGYAAKGYEGDFEIKLFEYNGKKYCDIGIGGLDVNS